MKDSKSAAGWLESHDNPVTGMVRRIKEAIQGDERAEKTPAAKAKNKKKTASRKKAGARASRKGRSRKKAARPAAKKTARKKTSSRRAAKPAAKKARKRRARRS